MMNKIPGNALSADVSPQNVEMLISGIGAHICDQLCGAGKNLLWKRTFFENTKKRMRLFKLLKPAEIKKHLDQYVIGQDDAKKCWQLLYTTITKELVNDAADSKSR
jgi:ATP-dependent protease Clp ATPase subunit